MECSKHCELHLVATPEECGAGANVVAGTEVSLSTFFCTWNGQQKPSSWHVACTETRAKSCPCCPPWWLLRSQLHFIRNHKKICVYLSYYLVLTTQTLKDTKHNFFFSNVAHKMPHGKSVRITMYNKKMCLCVFEVLGSLQYVSRASPPVTLYLCPQTPSSVYRNQFLAIFYVFLAPVLRYF